MSNYLFFINQKERFLGYVGLEASFLRLIPIVILSVILILFPGCKDYSKEASRILQDTGVKGGLIVHIGVQKAKLTAALGADSGYIVHGLCRNKENVDLIRKYIKDKGIYGKVSVEHFTGNKLPYVTNMVNLLVAENPEQISEKEMMRVLAPNGKAYVRTSGAWIIKKKPKPEGMDDWPQYLYKSTNNAVSQDTLVGPPRNLQWVGNPRWTRHHDHMESLSAMVSSEGRIYYIMDEGPTASIMLPPDWKLIARDGFNGTKLWEKAIHKWVHPLWPLKSGPAQLPRRLVAQDDKIFATLSIDGPVKKLAGATGEVLKTYQNTKGTEEIVCSDGLLYALVNPDRVDSVYEYQKDIGKYYYNREFWKGETRFIKAFNPKTGKLLWEKETSVLPLTLTVDDSRVYFYDGNKIQCLNANKGESLWSSAPLSRASRILSFYAPMLVIHNDVVLFAGGERAGQQRGEWYDGGEDQMTALSAETGEKLWSAHHPASGYRSPEDIFVINDLVWAGNITNGIADGRFTGRNLHTGKIEKEFLPDIAMHWFHHRCYRNKATEKGIITGRTGIEYIDPFTGQWDANHWIRGACLYGTMPANGLTYAPPHACACFPEAKLSGFNAVAAENLRRKPIKENNRLVKGPAYNKKLASAVSPVEGEWPTYRHNNERSGNIQMEVPEKLKTQWKTHIGGDLSTLVMANNTIYVAGKDVHTLYALKTSDGKQKWSFTSGGRIDSPPTIYMGKVYFGSADGCIYCLNQDNGKLIWKYRAARDNRKIMSYEQLESLWPVPGSVLVKDGEVWFASGRSMYLDGGIRLYRLDASSGEKISVTTMDKTNPETGENLQKATTWLTMPVALPDILSSDADYVYMRSQKFNEEGKRVEIDPLSSTSYKQLMNEAEKPELDQMFDDPNILQSTFKNYYHLFLDSITSEQKGKHLFAPYGFLDDSWFHRSYWVYGKYYVGGWNGYYLPGKYMPAGRIMVHDEENVYSFGRKPQYYRWTTPMEYQLFSVPMSVKVDTTLNQASARGGIEQIGAEAMRYSWNRNIPVLVRGMVLANNTLFISGPPDLVNEEDAQNHYADSNIQAKLKKQKKALQGKEGGLLWAVNRESGAVKAKYRIDSPPVWDGLIAADNKLFMATMDGNVICWGE
jgi:outer membrane protein assembly factor BamB